MSEANKTVSISTNLITVAMFVFGVLKLAHVIDVSWWVILFPLTFSLAVLAIILMIGLFLVGAGGMLVILQRYKSKKRSEARRNKYI